MEGWNGRRFVLFMFGVLVAELLISSEIPFLKSFLVGVDASEDLSLAGGFIQRGSPVYLLDYLRFVGFFFMVVLRHCFEETQDWLFGYGLWKFARALDFYCTHKSHKHL